KPTVGRISRYGVIPITADQDTPGPMTRNVTDAAILLGVLESKSPDPKDPATARCVPPPNRDYTRFLKRDGLKGARIGIPRTSFYESLTPERAKAMQDAIDVLKHEGAVVVDPAEIPSLVNPDLQENFGRWNICSGAGNSKGNDSSCS